MKTAMLAGILACCAAAQTSGEPPLLLKLIRVPGQKAGSIRPYVEAHAPVNVVGMSAITGTPETWMIESHYSFAGIEDLDRALARITNAAQGSSDDLLAPPRTLIAMYRPGWSYRPDQALKWLYVARYCQVSIYQTRPGGEAEFGELVKLRRSNRDSINIDRPDLAYRVISGAPSGTYVFLAPLPSLRMLDEALIKEIPVHAESAVEANARTAVKIAAEIEIMREQLLFRIEPRMSYVSDEFASADPEFWHPKR